MPHTPPAARETADPSGRDPAAAGSRAALDTMTVTVRDRAAEAPWGCGPTSPVTRTVTISAFCPCGGRRGEPRGLNSCDDGAYFWVQVWDNPCGHVDFYEQVLAEARELTASTGGAR